MSEFYRVDVTNTATSEQFRADFPTQTEANEWVLGVFGRGGFGTTLLTELEVVHSHINGEGEGAHHAQVRLEKLKAEIPYDVDAPVKLGDSLMHYIYTGLKALEHEEADIFNLVGSDPLVLSIRFGLFQQAESLLEICFTQKIGFFAEGHLVEEHYNKIKPILQDYNSAEVVG